MEYLPSATLPTVLWVGRHLSADCTESNQQSRRYIAVGFPCLVFDCQRDELTKSGVAVSVLTRAIAILSDLLVLIIIWMKSADAWRTNLRIEVQSRPRLLTLFVRDGESKSYSRQVSGSLYVSRYFVFHVSMLSEYTFHALLTTIASALFTLNMVTLLLDVTTREDDQPTAVTSFIYVTTRWVHLATLSVSYSSFEHALINSVSATLVARFILDFRSAYSSDSVPSQTASSTLLTTYVGGDIAAPLESDSIWVAGLDDDLGSDCGDWTQTFARPRQQSNLSEAGDVGSKGLKMYATQSYW